MCPSILRTIVASDILFEVNSLSNETDTFSSQAVILKYDNLIQYVYLLVLLLIIVLVALIYKEKRKEKKRKYEKGLDFEKYVLNLFKPKEWSIENWTRDVSEEIGRRVKSDSDPDFTFKHIKSGKIVSIECKYRAELSPGPVYGEVIYWAKDYQISHYNKFQDEKGHLVFIIIGLGGKPSKPQRMFLIPLYRLKYRFANINYLEKFERDIKTPISIEELNKLNRQNFISSKFRDMY